MEWRKYLQIFIPIAIIIWGSYTLISSYNEFRFKNDPYYFMTGRERILLAKQGCR